MNRGRGRVGAAAGAVVAGLLLAACGHQAAQPIGGNGAGQPARPPTGGGSPGSGAAGSTTTTTSPLAYSGGGIQSNANQSPNSQSNWVLAPVNSPLGVAKQYNMAEHSVDYTDIFAPNGFLASVVAVQPYCTQQVYAQLSAQQEESIKLGKNSPQLALYRQIVADEVFFIDDVARVARIDEAGWTATSEWVNVTYRVVVNSANGGHQSGTTSSEHYHVSDINGTWLVDQLPNPTPQAG